MISFVFAPLWLFHYVNACVLVLFQYFVPKNMKFAEHLSAHITPEWRKQYISYEELKSMLYIAVEEMPSAEYVEGDEVLRHVAQFDDDFFHQCDSELKKVNNFFAEKLAEAVRKFGGLKAELEMANKPPGKRGSTKMADSKLNLHGKPLLPPKKLQELKLAFTEFYLGLVLLQNYQNLNFTGFRKILKKHDKLLKETNGADWRREHVETTQFYTNKDIDKLISETEQTFTVFLESGDRQKAMKRLRVPPLGDRSDPWLTFKVGLFSGLFIVLFVAVLLASIMCDKPCSLQSAIRLYRAPILLVIFLFLMGINVYGWRSSGVNHVLIFELDPRNHLSEQHLIELAAIFGVGWTLSVLSFLRSADISIPNYVGPLGLLLILVLYITNPIKTFRYEARFWLMRVVVKVFLAPLFHVGFADFWLADQLNSLTIVFTDLHYSLCYYLPNDSQFHPAESNSAGDNPRAYEISRVIVNCLPAWIRFAQCIRRYCDSGEAFPHLANAGKYGSSMVTIVCLALFNNNKGSDIYTNPFFYLYVISAMISTIYAYTWDVKMDWGLFDSYKPESKFLRDEMVYSSTLFYYFAIVEDFVVRFIWTATFYIAENRLIPSELVTTVVAFLEVFRRFIWNFFRLENEHLNNCGKFRAVRDISVTPLDWSDPNIIIKMMDDEDSVVNRKKRKPGVLNKKLKEDKKVLLATQQEEPISSYPMPI